MLFRSEALKGAFTQFVETRTKEGEHLKQDILQKLSGMEELVHEIEIQGALKVKERFPETLLLFVTPPTAEELRRRLVSRGTETPEVIESRLARAVEEAEYMDQYDYLVINDDLDTCVCEMHAIIQSEHRRSFRNKEFIQNMKQELKGNVKGDR